MLIFAELFAIPQAELSAATVYPRGRCLVRRQTSGFIFLVKAL